MDRAPQRLQTFWDSACILSHDPIRDSATRALGVSQHMLSEGHDKSNAERQIKKHACRYMQRKLISALVWQQ